MNAVREIETCLELVDCGPRGHDFAGGNFCRNCGQGKATHVQRRKGLMFPSRGWTSDRDPDVYSWEQLQKDIADILGRGGWEA